MTMRVRFLRGTALGGVGNDASQGDERDLPDGRASQLIATGRAIAVTVSESPVASSDEALMQADEAAARPQRRKAK